MKSQEIDNFIELNLQNFQIKSGWHSLVRKMLFEFCIAGWDMNERVYGKEKFGELRCYHAISDTLKEIIAVYSSLSLRTCEVCGGCAKSRGVNSWSHTLCFKHYMELLGELKIDDLVVSKNDEKFDLKACHRVEFDADYKSASFYKHGPSVQEMPWCTFTSQQPNYYLLLKQLPKTLLTKEQSDYIDSFFASLCPCDICGHIAVYEDSCKYCYSETWETERDKDLYADDTAYIKDYQLYIYIDEFDLIKEKESDTSFEKSERHKILFNYKELVDYRNETSKDN